MIWRDLKSRRRSLAYWICKALGSFNTQNNYLATRTGAQKLLERETLWSMMDQYRFLGPWRKQYLKGFASDIWKGFTAIIFLVFWPILVICMSAGALIYCIAARVRATEIVELSDSWKHEETEGGKP